jgi:hypothetical protein
LAQTTLTAIERKATERKNCMMMVVMWVWAGERVYEGDPGQVH